MTAWRHHPMHGSISSTWAGTRWLLGICSYPLSAISTSYRYCSSVCVSIVKMQLDRRAHHGNPTDDQRDADVCAQASLSLSISSFESAYVPGREEGARGPDHDTAAHDDLAPVFRPEPTAVATDDLHEADVEQRAGHDCVSSGSHKEMVCQQIIIRTRGTVNGYAVEVD